MEQKLNVEHLRRKCSQFVSVLRIIATNKTGNTLEDFIYDTIQGHLITN